MKTEKDKIQDMISDLDKTLHCLPDHQTINAKDSNAMAHIEALLDSCNAMLHKSKMHIPQGLNWGKTLLQDAEFYNKMQQIKRLAETVDIEKLHSTDLSFPFKYAEFLSNQHYALLMSAQPSEKCVLAEQALQDYDAAIALMESVRHRFGFRNFKDFMQYVSKHAIPILHCRIRILASLYGTENILNREDLLNEAIEFIKFSDRKCINILKRPTHMSVAIINRAELQRTARNSKDPKTLFDCYANIEAYRQEITTVYREDDTLHDWSTDPFNLLIIEESRGHCLLKLDKLEEAYQAFDHMFVHAMNSNNEVRAGWARLNQAKVLIAAREQLFIFSVPEWSQLSFIRDLLIEAQHKESLSEEPTWAREDIARKLHYIDNHMLSDEEIFKMDDLPGQIKASGPPSLLPGYDAIQSLPKFAEIKEAKPQDTDTPEKKKVTFSPDTIYTPSCRPSRGGKLL